ncbi:MAG TPA: ATP-binding protein [Pyrinomonadaceae bacterium]|jgi:signal transduction histidine kinase
MESNEMPDKLIEGVGVPVPAADVVMPVAPAPDHSVTDCVEALRRVSAFSDLPAEQLEWFIDNSEEVEYDAGDFVFQKGDPPDWMVIYLEGEVQARWDEHNLDDFVYIARAGDPATEISGKLPFSRMKEIEINGRAVVRTRVLRFPSRLFPELIERLPALAERLVWIMLDRTRESIQMDERRDKLMALGKLSAGLAHELNNPAAAARRTSDELARMLEELRLADLDLCRHELAREQRERLADFELAAINENAPEVRNALDLNDREDAVAGWLEAHQVAESWQLAPVLAEAGVTPEKLERISENIPPAALQDVLRRVALQISAAKSVKEIRTSVTRISELVGAIKEYSYMDQAAVQKVDLHQGLDNTLLILKYKLKKKNVEVLREYDADLPPITAHGSLLNQVWTNLIDNAVDAMPASGGRLRIKTRLEPEDILVEIRDNGAGIPPEAQPHIFEPFYTTKGVNEGTGLGLDAVSRIVRKHRGDIRFATKPGDTCFEIRLPLELQ